MIMKQARVITPQVKKQCSTGHWRTSELLPFCFLSYPNPSSMGNLYVNFYFIYLLKQFFFLRRQECLPFFIYKFNFGCVGFLLRREGATLHYSVWTSRCSGFSCHGAWAPGTWASVVVARGLSSCGTWA